MRTGFDDGSRASSTALFGGGEHLPPRQALHAVGSCEQSVLTLHVAPQGRPLLHTPPLQKVHEPEHWLLLLHVWPHTSPGWHLPFWQRPQFEYAPLHCSERHVACE